MKSAALKLPEGAYSPSERAKQSSCFVRSFSPHGTMTPLPWLRRMKWDHVTESDPPPHQ